jgi:hypothetical protein
VSEDLRERLLDILADVCMNVHVHDYEALPGGIDLGEHADAILALLPAPATPRPMECSVCGAGYIGSRAGEECGVEGCDGRLYFVVAEASARDGMSYKERADLYGWLHQEQSRRMHALHEYVQTECSNEPEWVPGGYWLDTALALLKRLRSPAPTAAEPEREVVVEVLRALHAVLRARHHGCMPKEVQEAYDRAGEVLRALATPEAEGGSP